MPPDNSVMSPDNLCLVYFLTVVFFVSAEGDWVSWSTGDQPSSDDGQGGTGPWSHALRLQTGESLCSVLSCCAVGLVALTPVSCSALCFLAVLWYCWP